MVEKVKIFPKIGAGKKFTFPSPAKLNLFLYITGRRENGYHDLQTLFQFLDFGDELEITLRSDNKIIVTPEIEGFPIEENLIYRAAKLLQQKTNRSLGAELHITKRIPMGAGLGGGSSNAATTLVALNQLWQTGLSLDELAELGLSLGADVPIFVKGEASFAEGIGEKLQPCSPPEKWYLVLKPEVFISTAVIFNHPELPRNTPKRTMKECLALPYGNDCEKVVKKAFPEVEEALSWLLKYAPARLTGTGACVFAEFDDENEAKKCLSLKPKGILGFVAQGKNRSPLHQFIFQ